MINFDAEFQTHLRKQVSELEESVVMRTSQGWLGVALASLLLFAGVSRQQVWAEQRGVYVTPLPGKEGGLISETKVYDHSYAVVIGIDAYQKLPQLTGAVRDARTVKKALEEQGFTVTEVIDSAATRQAIAELLGDKLRYGAGPEDRVLVFFAGHGVSTGTGDTAMGYLMPVEGVREAPVSTGISMMELQNWFAGYQAKHVMFVADACYSGLALSTRATGLSPQTMDYLKKVTKKKVRVALVAGGAGEEVNELHGQGLFTSFFLEAIGGVADADKNGVITSDEIAAYVKPNVAQTAMQLYQTDQNPQIGRRGEGEFIFLNPMGARHAFFSKPLEQPRVEQISEPKREMTALAKGGWTLLGIGAAGIVTGGVMYKFTQDEIDKQSSSFSGDHAAAEIYSAVSYTSFAIGGAALATGAILLIVDSVQRPKVAVFTPLLGSDGKSVMAWWGGRW